MINNVLQLQPRRRREPSGLFVELRLGHDFSIELSLHDSTGVVGTLEYGLTVKSPEDFDLNRLRTEWDRWREHSESVA